QVVRGGRDQRRDPAPGGNAYLSRDHRDQQGPGGPDPQDRRHRRGRGCVRNPPAAHGSREEGEGGSLSSSPAESGALEPKPVAASQVVMTELVLPNDANMLGNVLGGKVLHLIDIA